MKLSRPKKNAISKKSNFISKIVEKFDFLQTG